jgi:hypothetical protein
VRSVFLSLVLFFGLLGTVYAQDDQNNLNASQVNKLDWDQYKGKAILSMVYKDKFLRVKMHTSFENVFDFDELPSSGSALGTWNSYKSKWENSTSMLRTTQSNCDFSKGKKTVESPAQSGWFQLLSITKCESSPKGMRVYIDFFDGNSKIRELDVTIEIEGSPKRFVNLENGKGEVVL